jgi:hypothetical protein
MGHITWMLNKNIPNSTDIVHFEPDTGLPYTFKMIQTKIYIPVKGTKSIEDTYVEDTSVEDTSVEENDVPILPEQYRQFAKMDGNHLYPYFCKTDFMITDIALILKHYPSWESIKESDEWAKNGWDETKHNLFKECLEWCNTQGGFWGQWPY